MIDPTVSDYVQAIGEDNGSGYLDPQPKRYPPAPCYALPWPGPGQPEPGDDVLGRLSRVLLGFAPRRADTITIAAADAFKGTVTSAPHPAFKLMPGWLALRLTVPSGGGLHPTEIYLAWGGSPQLPAGVYHYCPLRHGLELLRPGDLGDRLDRLLGGALDPLPDHGVRGALLLTHRPWKNADKYRSFGYRLGVIDAGVLLGQMVASVAAAPMTLDPDQDTAAELLALNPMLEAVYAVVGLDLPDPSATPHDSTSPLADRASMPRPTGVAHDERGLSDADPRTLALHRAILTEKPVGEAPLAPFEEAAALADDEPAVVTLPPAPALDLHSAGTIRASAANLRSGLNLQQFATILAYAARGAETLARQTLYPRLWCLVSQIDGIEPGVYRYDPHRHALLGRPGTATADLAEALPHAVDPRMATCGAILYPVSPPGRAVTSLSPAQYRRLHLLAGVTVQLSSLAAAAVGAAGRAVGGMTVQAVAGRLGLPAPAIPLMQVILGLPATRPGFLTASLTNGGRYG